MANNSVITFAVVISPPEGHHFRSGEHETRGRERRTTEALPRARLQGKRACLACKNSGVVI